MTFENYRLKSNTSATDEDLVKALRVVVGRMLPNNNFDEWVKSIEDQSVEDKGIKYELKIGKDIVHAFLRNGRSIYLDTDWEFYLNKKKISAYDLREHLESTLMSEIEVFLKYAFSFDFYSGYIDDPRRYREVESNNAVIKDMFNKLSSGDKKKAVKELLKKFDKDQVEGYFKV